MILSMTGYGKGSASNSNWQADAEVKSINSRYLEIFLKYPSILANKEYELREFIKSKIKRGKLNVSIQIKKNGSDETNISLDESRLKNYVSLIKKVKKTAKLNDKIKLEHILMSRDIFSASVEEIDEQEFAIIKQALSNSLDLLLKMKRNEGKELEKDLKKRIRSIEENLTKIEAEAEPSVGEHFNKYKEKVKNLLDENQSINNERLETELAIMAERADITEECVRLRSHIKFFKDSLQKEEDPGRKLNFLCHIKEEIERIREQIQNIE